MDQAQGRTVEQLFKDKAVTLAQVCQDVHVLCDSATDAATVFNWLEQQINNPQTQTPFPDKCRVRALQDTHQVCFREGDSAELDGDVCMAGFAYRARTCVWHPAHSWLVQIDESMFKAEDFELARPATPGDPPPFADGTAVQCLRSSPDYTEAGWLADNSRCMSSYKYVVNTCRIRPDGGWFVVIGGDLHMAEDFKLWDDCEQSP